MKYIVQVFNDRGYEYFSGSADPHYGYRGGFDTCLHQATLFESEHVAQSTLVYLRQIGMAMGIGEVISKTDAEIFKIKLKGE